MFESLLVIPEVLLNCLEMVHEIKTKCRQESILFATLIVFHYPDEKVM